MSGLSEIARAAGVSISTVSRVLNRRAGVNEETRQRVLSVLTEMPYTPRGLGALQRTGVIGLLVPELSNPVFPAFAEALETRAARLGYSSLLCNTRSGIAMGEEEYVRMLLARGVEGMVFVSPEITNVEVPLGQAPRPSYYAKLLADGVHMVFLNGATPALDVPDVTVDEQIAGYLATKHLIELGHERDRVRLGPGAISPSRLKRAGWAAALEENHLPAGSEFVAHGPFSAEGGGEALAALLDTVAPTAVICSSDHMALGVMREAHQRGISIPDELSGRRVRRHPAGRLLVTRPDDARAAHRGDGGRGDRRAGAAPGPGSPQAGDRQLHPCVPAASGRAGVDCAAEIRRLTELVWTNF